MLVAGGGRWTSGETLRRSAASCFSGTCPCSSPLELRAGFGNLGHLCSRSSPMNSKAADGNASCP
jgi:hypothetical protein